MKFDLLKYLIVYPKGLWSFQHLLAEVFHGILYDPPNSKQIRSNFCLVVKSRIVFTQKHKTFSLSVWIFLFNDFWTCFLAFMYKSGKAIEMSIFISFKIKVSQILLYSFYIQNWVLGWRTLSSLAHAKILSRHFCKEYCWDCFAVNSGLNSIIGWIVLPNHKLLYLANYNLCESKFCAQMTISTLRPIERVVW